jgi:hypothetical protein
MKYSFTKYLPVRNSPKQFGSYKIFFSNKKHIKIKVNHIFIKYITYTQGKEATLEHIISALLQDSLVIIYIAGFRHRP